LYRWPCHHRDTAASEGRQDGELLAGHTRNRHLNNLWLNLADVSRIDSAGFAYMIGSLASVRKRHGDLKLLNPSENVRAVMELSKLSTVFEVGEDEASAVKSFAN